MAPTPSAPPLGQAIYANRNLRLDCVEAIGFDMDYTLARYAREHLEVLAHRLTLEKLVDKGYPAEILQLPYTPAFVIRGLVVDKLLGNIIKLDRHNHPCRIYHGRAPLDRQTRRSTYRRERIAFAPPRFALVDTLFSLPEVSIYAHLVDFFDACRTADPAGSQAAPTGTLPNYAQLFDDVRAAIDTAHQDGSLKGEVQKNLGHYIERDAALPKMLQDLRAAGKKIFLATNSAWNYTHAVMNFLLPTQAGGRDGAAPFWCSFFDLVVCSAKKPDFFVQKNPLAPVAPTRDTPSAPAHAYVGGSLPEVEQFLRVSGEAILYVGDHIFGDILRSKKASLWRTALVVEELEDEVLRTEQLTHLVAQLRTLEQQLSAVPAGMDAAGHGNNQTQLISRMRTLEDEVAQAFNPYWGMVFKEDHENSRFGEQVASYACLYMARVASLRYYAADHYFRSPRDFMPHEPRELAAEQADFGLAPQPKVLAGRAPAAPAHRRR